MTTKLKRWSTMTADELAAATREFDEVSLRLGGGDR